MATVRLGCRARTSSQFFKHEPGIYPGIRDCRGQRVTVRKDPAQGSGAEKAGTGIW